jgi:tetratricopeptide (TPR) repeat protein
MDTDAYFAGRHDQPIQRNHVFVDRTECLDIFIDRLKEHLRERHARDSLLDFERPARNVLAFYGEGGIGKTAVLGELGRAFGRLDDAALPRDRALISLDMADYNNHNFETVLMRLRAGLGQAVKTWPAFDRGLARFWATKYPGVPLVQFIAKSSYLSAQERSELAGQMSGVADSLVGAFGAVSFAYWLTRALARRVIPRLQRRKLIKEFEPFRVLMEEADPEKLLGYLPILLAWDLEEHRQRRNVAALCIFDTFETVQSGHRERGSLEDLIVRLAYLAPNIFFVFAGRAELEWHKPENSIFLTYGSGARWSSLDSDSPLPAQYALGRLSAEDADFYLRSRMTAGGAPAINEVIRKRIVDGSDGWPLYLDLSADLFRELALAGKPTAADAFGGSFPQLVLAIMRDLSGAERDLLRAAALFTSFDAEILGAAVPGVRGSTLEKFLARGFIRTTGGKWPASSIHAALRRSVLECDRYTDESWTAQDRRDRLLAATARVEDTGLAVWREAAPESSDSAELANQAQMSVSAFLLSLEAALQHGVLPARLGLLAFTVSQMGYWRVMSSLKSSGNAPAPLRRLIDTAQTSVDVTKDPAARWRDLSARIAPQLSPRIAPRLSHAYDEYVIFELATTAQLAGEDDDAESLYSSLDSAHPIIRDAATWALAGLAFRRSDLLGALRRAALVSGDRPLDHVRNRDLLGHVYLHGGEFERAASFYAGALADARGAAAPLWIARAARHVTLANMWFRPEQALRLLPEAYELNLALGEQIGVAQCELARGLSLAMLGKWKEAERWVAAARDRTDDYGAVGHPFAVMALINMARGRAAEAESYGQAVFEHASRRVGVNPPLWSAVTALWLGRPDLFEFDSVGWYDSADAARQRWLAPLNCMAAAARSGQKGA